MKFHQPPPTDSQYSILSALPATSLAVLAEVGYKPSRRAVAEATAAPLQVAIFKGRTVIGFKPPYKRFRITRSDEEIASIHNAVVRNCRGSLRLK